MNTCLICQGKIKPFRTIHDYHLVECTNCKIIKLINSKANQSKFIENTHKQHGQLKDKESSDEYDYFSFPEYVKKYESTFTHFFNQRLGRIKAHGIQGNDRILDAGCGYGFFVKYCMDNGFKATGIDIEPNCVEYAKTNLKLQSVHHSSLELFNREDKKYNAIISCDVLEHCKDPMSFMQSCKNLLKPKGLLYLQVPNVIGFRIPHGYSLGLPYHIWHYNPQSLRHLLERNNFEVLDYWTGTSGVINQKEKKHGDFLFSLKTSIASKLKIGIRLQMLARCQG